jgi:hypothetical protein
LLLQGLFLDGRMLLLWWLHVAIFLDLHDRSGDFHDRVWDVQRDIFDDRDGQVLLILRRRVFLFTLWSPS